MITCADYSFEQIAGNGASILDDNFQMAFGKHRIAYATFDDVAKCDIVKIVEFTGYLRSMSGEFEVLYNLPENVWCPANARGLSKSKNVVNRVVSFRLSSMTEVEDTE